MAVLGLPATTRACLSDLDGVLTKTAVVHAAAWKTMFDGYLAERAKRTGEPFVSFDDVRDYDEHVDRVGQAAALSAHGADLVVADLAELLERG